MRALPRPMFAVLLHLAAAAVACRADRSSELEGKVEAALHGDPTVPPISVTANRGVVTLTGVVDSDGDRAHVDALVRGVPGVVAVDDRLQLRTPPVVTSATQEGLLEASIESSLRAEDFQDLDVEIREKTVLVTGSLPAGRRADAMRIVVAKVPRGYHVQDASIETPP